MGAILSQGDENGSDYPIEYASRALSAAESNYSAFEKEAIGVIFALKKFRNYLSRIDSNYTLTTKHSSMFSI